MTREEAELIKHYFVPSSDKPKLPHWSNVWSPQCQLVAGFVAILAAATQAMAAEAGPDGDSVRQLLAIDLEEDPLEQGV